MSLWDKKSPSAERVEGRHAKKIWNCGRLSVPLFLLWFIVQLLGTFFDKERPRLLDVPARITAASAFVQWQGGSASRTVDGHARCKIYFPCVEGMEKPERIADAFKKLLDVQFERGIVQVKCYHTSILYWFSS